MTPEDIRATMLALGRRWGLDRPLRAAEMARALGYGGRDPGRTVQDWLAGKPPSPPAVIAMRMILAGAEPPTRDVAIFARRDADERGEE